MELNNNKVPSSNKFPIVGIGASVACLDAIKKLIKTIPQDPGLAFGESIFSHKEVIADSSTSIGLPGRQVYCCNGHYFKACCHN